MNSSLPTVVFILETPPFNASISGRPALMGSGEVFGDWNVRLNALQINRSMYTEHNLFYQNLAC